MVKTYAYYPKCPENTLYTVFSCNRGALIKGKRIKREAAPLTIDIIKDRASVRGINADNICFEVCDSCYYSEGFFSGSYKCDYCEVACLRDMCDV